MPLMRLSHIPLKYAAVQTFLMPDMKSGIDSVAEALTHQVKVYMGSAGHTSLAVYNLNEAALHDHVHYQVVRICRMACPCGPICMCFCGLSCSTAQECRSVRCP